MKKTLHRLGYAQELMRRMSGFSNFAVSFTIISILSGCLTLYYFGMDLGGPAVIVWGWLGVGVMTLLVGLAMAEVCSSYPTAGGLYYWSAKLAPKNGTGLVLVHRLVQLHRPGRGYGRDRLRGRVLHQRLPEPPVRPGLRALGDAPDLRGRPLGAWPAEPVRHPAGLQTERHQRLVAHPGRAHHRRRAYLRACRTTCQAGQVFTGLFNNSGLHIGWWYIIPVGLLTAQYTFTGYDASAHMTEETHAAATSGPRGIVMSIIVSLVAGFVLLLGMTFAIQGPVGGAKYLGEAAAGSAAPAQIWQDAIGLTGAKFLLLIAIGAQLFCGMSSITANSRMIYAFSRDGALPYSRVWHRVNKRTRTPTNAIWLGATGALILGLPYLWNGVAYGAVTSIAVIGLYIAYVLPTFLRRRQGANFVPGPWSLGKWSAPIGWAAVVWVAFIAILFMLPQFGPVTSGGTLDLDTFNYARHRGRRGHRLRRDLVGGLGQELVHRA